MFAGQLGVSEATFYIWKKKYAHLGVSELLKLRSLKDENNRLKRLVADLTLDKHMLAEALSTSPCIAVPRRSPLDQPSAGAWILCTMRWRTAVRFAC
jgi:hypothetical protein